MPPVSQDASINWRQPESIGTGLRRAYNGSIDFATSTNGKNILKCSLAYLLGSCGVFVPIIANLLGKQDGKHIVATITVYFHAARSAGSMIEATFCALIAFLYAALLSFTSMGVTIWFSDRRLLVLGHIVVLFIFLGGGLGFLAWIKVRLSNPLVNVACSLASLASITVFTKEGSIQAAQFSEVKVVQVLKMVILGITFAILVNLFVFPESARRKLNLDLAKCTDHISSLLSVITKSFIQGSEMELNSKLADDAAKNLKSSLTSLKSSLTESKWEHYIRGDETQHDIESELAKCLQKMSQNLGGLKSAALMQFDLIRDTRTAIKPVPQRSYSKGSSFIFRTTDLMDDRTSPETILDTVDETDQTKIGESGVSQSPQVLARSLSNASNITIINPTPSDMFNSFISRLGPSMRSLTQTLALILDDLPFDGDLPDKIAVNANFQSSLKSAVDLFQAARTEAIAALYRSKEINRTTSAEKYAEYEEIAASCGHFSFALIDFADEVGHYLELLEELKVEREQLPRRPSYQWLFFWRAPRLRVTRNPDERLLGDTEAPTEDGPAAIVPSELLRNNSTVSIKPSSAKPAVSNNLVKMSNFLARDDIRFAIKVGLGAALLAAPAFISFTRPTFQHLRLEWGLVSYMVVCSMTIGAANTTGTERFIGTMVGAIVAWGAWLLSNARAIPLMFFGWIMSLLCFYIILVMKKGPMGRFIFLTYNLSALYAYSLSIKDDEESDDDEGGINPYIKEIVLHRVVAVTIGCFWGIMITRVIWPIRARTKLKEGMSLLWLRMGLIWKRDPFALITYGHSESKYMDIREEANLQNFLISLDGLRASAKSEFEIRGPFPEAAYARIIEYTHRMLDSFHAMNVVISKNLRATVGAIEVLRYTQVERHALSARISHLFSVLASTVKMEYPLSDVLPNIESSRDRLLTKVFEFRKTATAQQVATDADYELIYAYCEFCPLPFLYLSSILDH